MKKKFLVFSFALLALSACGSGNNLVTPTGPDLDLGELAAIKIDQLKFTGGLTNDNTQTPDATLYIQCANDSSYIACAGPDQGLDIVKKEGVIYGRLNAAFVTVDDIVEGSSCFDAKVVFVEKDSAPCPATVSNKDDIVWTSPTLSLSESGTGSLLKNKIAPEDNSVIAYLITDDNDSLEDLILTTSPQADNTLKLDQLYITGVTVNASTNYKVVVRAEEGALRCEASFTGGSVGIERSEIIYGNLNITLNDEAGNPCLLTDENRETHVIVSLFIDSNDPFTMEDSTTLIDLVDNDGGREDLNPRYLRFVPIDTAI